MTRKQNRDLVKSGPLGMDTLFGNTKYSVKNKSIIQLEKEWLKEYRIAFESIRKEWWPAIRDFMREEIGLSLHQRRKGLQTEKDTNLQFEFLCDHEGEFLSRIDNTFPNLDFDELMAYQTLYNEMVKSYKFFTKSGKPRASFEYIQKYLVDYLLENDIENILDELFKDRSHTFRIFGYYIFNTNQIEIFYIPLLLFSRLNKIGFKYCLIVTLAHEAAHAFHHVGKDKDGHKWHDMPSVDNEITEGLAQYFTACFVDQFALQFPELKTAYDTFIKRQSGPYLVHMKWIKEFQREHIRQAMLVARRTQIRKYDIFYNQMRNARELLK